MLLHYMARSTSYLLAILDGNYLFVTAIQLALLSACLQGTRVPDVWLQVIARCSRSWVSECASQAVGELVSLVTAEQMGE
jgi:hypothetical protein